MLFDENSYNLQFTKEETDLERTQVTCLRLHLSKWQRHDSNVNLRLNPE